MSGAGKPIPKVRPTSTDLEVRLRPLRPSDEPALFGLFRAVVAAGEGYPQDPAVPLHDDEIRGYWITSMSAAWSALTI